MYYNAQSRGTTLRPAVHLAAANYLFSCCRLPVVQSRLIIPLLNVGRLYTCTSACLAVIAMTTTIWLIYTIIPYWVKPPLS